jgi:fibronectin-binding autotransporter adhesin
VSLKSWLCKNRVAIINPTNNHKNYSNLLAAWAIILNLTLGSALAGTTWDGGGGSSTNWGTAANWDNNTLPTFNSSTTLTFGTAGSTATVDLSRTVNRIVVNRDANFTINGTSTLTLYGGVTINSGQTAGRSYGISAPINFGAANTWTVEERVGGLSNILGVSGNINNGGYLLSVDNDGWIDLSGTVSGTGGINFGGIGTLELSHANTYTGKIVGSQGMLNIHADNNLGAAPGSFVADQITLSGNAVLWAENTFSLNANRGITLGSSGGSFMGNSGKTLTVPGAITGSGFLGVNGSGSTLVLSGNNTYTGFTAVYDTLQISADNGLGTAPTSFVANQLQIDYDGILLTTATFSLNANRGITLGNNYGPCKFSVASGTTLTVPGVITGSGGALSKVGSGTLLLTANNTYTGATSVDDGTLRLSGAGQLPATSNTTVIGTLDLNNVSTTIGSLAGYGSVLLGNGTLTIGGNLASSNFSGVIGGTGGKLVKAGSGAMTLSGASANTYSGLTTVNADTLLLGKTSNANAIANGGLMLGDGANVATVTYTGTSTDMMGTGAVTINRRGTLDFNGKTDTIGNVAISSNSTYLGQISNTAGGGALTIGTLGFTGGGNVATSTGKIGLGGNVTYNTGTNGVAATVSGNIDLNSTRTFTIADDAGLASEMNISAVIANGGSASGLTKVGPGTLNISGTSANTYTGLTTVNVGTILLGKTANVNAIANGGLTIGDGINVATVQYTGTSTNMMGTGTLTINRRGTLDFNSKTDTIGNVVISSDTTYLGQITNTTGGGALTIGTLDFTGGGNVATSTGKIVLGGNVTYNTGTNGVAATISGKIDLNAPLTITIANDAALLSEMDISAVIANGSSTSGLTKAGPGTLTLNALNTFSGDTTVNGGTLEIAGGIVLSGTSLIDIQSGKTVLKTVNVIKSDLDITTAELATFEIINGSHVVGSITGSGTTIVDSGANLTAASICQGTLIIGTLTRSTPSETTTSVPEPSVIVLLIGAFILLGLKEKVPFLHRKNWE